MAACALILVVAHAHAMQVAEMALHRANEEEEEILFNIKSKRKCMANNEFLGFY